jgi:hypothetical protein
MSSSGWSTSDERLSSGISWGTEGRRAVPPQMGHWRSGLALARSLARYSEARARCWCSWPQLRHSHGNHSVPIFAEIGLVKRARALSTGGGTRHSTTSLAPCAAMASTCSSLGTASGSTLETWAKSNATRPSRPEASRRTFKSPFSSLARVT